MIKLSKPVIKLKNKGQLAETLYREDYDKIIVYNDGKWARTTNMAQDSTEMVFCRSSHYNMTKSQCKSFVGAIEALLNGDYAYYEYIISLIRDARRRK